MSNTRDTVVLKDGSSEKSIGERLTLTGMNKTNQITFKTIHPNKPSPIHGVAGNTTRISLLIIRQTGHEWKFDSIKLSNKQDHKARLLTEKLINNYKEEGIENFYVGSSKVTNSQHFLILIDSRLIDTNNNKRVGVFNRIRGYLFSSDQRTTTFYKYSIINRSGAAKPYLEIPYKVILKLLGIRSLQNLNRALDPNSNATTYQKKIVKKLKNERENQFDKVKNHFEGKKNSFGSKKRKRDTKNNQGPSKGRTQHTRNTHPSGPTNSRFFIPVNIFGRAIHPFTKKRMTNNEGITHYLTMRNQKNLKAIRNLLKNESGIQSRKKYVHTLEKTPDGHILHRSKGKPISQYFIDPNEPYIPVFIEPVKGRSPIPYYRGSTHYFKKNAQNNNLSHNHMFFNYKNHEQHKAFIENLKKNNSKKYDMFRNRTFLPFAKNNKGHYITILPKGKQPPVSYPGKGKNYESKGMPFILYRTYPDRTNTMNAHFLKPVSNR